MRGTRLSLLAGLALLLLGAAPLQAAPTAEDRCASRMAEASGRYLDCAMRENGRAAKRGRAANLDRCERKLGRMTTRALRRWGSAVCPVVNQIGGEATTLGDQLGGLVSQMSQAVGVSDEGLSRAGAQCAAKKAKVVGQDLRCRAGALARAARWDRPVSEAACPERRLARKLARIEKKYGGACPGEGDAGTLATRGQLALSEVTDWVAPSMQRHAGVTDLLPLQKFSDADGDGIPDDIESWLTGTDPTHPDTDRDGRSDMVEFFHHKTDPLEYESPIATQNTEAAAKSARPAGEPLADIWRLGVPDTPLGFLLAGMSVACSFQSCNSAYSGQATRARIDVLSDQLTQEFKTLTHSLDAAFTESDTKLKTIQNMEGRALCKDAYTKIPALAQADCFSDGPYSVSCLYSAQQAALGKQGGGFVRKFFKKFGTDEAGNFPLATPAEFDLLAHIGTSGTDRGYADAIVNIQKTCGDLLASSKGISADSNLLGGDLIYQRAMFPFLAGTLHSYGTAIGFLSTSRSAQAWYYASPEVRKDAFWLAMQNQSTAAIPDPKWSENKNFRCRYPNHPGSVPIPCSNDAPCGSPYNTCEIGYDSYEDESCGDGTVLIGSAENGKCIKLLPLTEEIWKEEDGAFSYPATVTTQAMQAMNHVCQAWALHNPDPCTTTDDSESVTSTGFYCQQILCEPVAGASQKWVTKYWDAGRGYLNTVLNLGAPFTNSDFIYEPTRDVMWLKDPGWGDGAGIYPGQQGETGYLGLPQDRFFRQQAAGLEPNTVASWPSRLNETKKVVLTPATRAHWMGEGSAMKMPNLDGMAASALAGLRTCAAPGKPKKICTADDQCPGSYCSTVALRAGFGPSLLDKMYTKGDLIWPGSRVLHYRVCNSDETKACFSDYDCSHEAGRGVCTVERICEGGPFAGAPCGKDSECLKENADGSKGECINNPSLSPGTAYEAPAGEAPSYQPPQPYSFGNLACAAGWRQNHLLFMGGSFHGPYENNWNSWNSRTLGDSWGYNEGRDPASGGHLGSCQTGMNDLMPYPYVREFSFSGGPLSRDYGLQELSGGETGLHGLNPKYHCHSVNIPDLIDSCSGFKCNTADTTHDACDSSHPSSPVGLFGAWPHHPTWPSPPTLPSTQGHYNVGLNFGLSCNWLDQNTGAFSRCDDPAWRGGECPSRKRTGAQNSLNFISRKDCAPAINRPINYGYTTTTDNACANLKGVVPCQMFSGIKSYMKDPDYCLYPIKERNGSTDFGQHLDNDGTPTSYKDYAFPIACGSAPHGCTSNPGVKVYRNWINFRQCLSFSTSHNCAHLGVQTPYLLALQLPVALGLDWEGDKYKTLNEDYRIFPLVTPGGVASSTEMVASYAVNAVSRGFGCGKDVVYGKAPAEGVHSGRTAAQSAFLTIFRSLNDVYVGDYEYTYQPKFMWPVIDLFAAGQAAYLAESESPTNCGEGNQYGESGCGFMKACSTSKRRCESDADCEKTRPQVTRSDGVEGIDTGEKCVNVGPQRDGYAMVCPGVLGSEYEDRKALELPQVYYSFSAASDVQTVESCMQTVSGKLASSFGFDIPNDGSRELDEDCSDLFITDFAWDTEQVQKVVQSCRGDDDVASLCFEHCMWALKCYDAFHSRAEWQTPDGNFEGIRVRNLQKVVALNDQNFDKIGRDPSSCCSDAQCEVEIQQSLAPAIPAVFASYQPGFESRDVSDLGPDTGTGKGRTCSARDEATIVKVDTLRSCLDECYKCDGSDPHCGDMSCNYVHYNATWCTMFNHCESIIRGSESTVEDPYGGTLYSREEVLAFQEEYSHRNLLGDANGVPPGALFGNRACVTSFNHDNALDSPVHINGLSLSECADACAKQDSVPERKECIHPPDEQGNVFKDHKQWCRDDMDCSAQDIPNHYWGKCVPVSSVSPASCDSFSFYGGKWNYDPYTIHATTTDSGFSDHSPTKIGTETTCTLYPENFWGPVYGTGASASGNEPWVCGSGRNSEGTTTNRVFVAPHGWAVWPAPKETTWFPDQVDCTNPGGDPWGRTCSRAVPEAYARAFLDAGLSEIHASGAGRPQLQQGSECSPGVAGSCDAKLGLKCAPSGETTRCKGPEPGELHGPCLRGAACYAEAPIKVNTDVCHVLPGCGDDDVRECSVCGEWQMMRFIDAGWWPIHWDEEIEPGDECEITDTWLSNVPATRCWNQADGQCIPRGVCNGGLTCTLHADSSSSDSSGFWMTEAWRPGGTCL